MKFSLPQHTIFYQLEKSMKLYRKLAQDRINKSGHDISVNQLILIVNLSEHPNATQVELSEYIFKDFASVARMVDILVRKDYLKRTESPLDRRKKDLAPTPKCKKMIEELKPVINNYRKVSLLRFTDNQLNQISSLLDKFIANCEKGLANESQYK